jgi:hypothetical protein
VSEEPKSPAASGDDPFTTASTGGSAAISGRTVVTDPGTRDSAAPETRPAAPPAEPATPPPASLTAGSPNDLPDREANGAVSIGEFLLLAAAVTIGLVSLVSLAAAHLHHHTPAVVGLGSVVAIALAALILLKVDRPRMRLDLTGLVPVLLGLGLGAVMLFPGFAYGTGDRDPGAYVEIASAIQIHHSVAFPDDLVQASLPGGVSPGAEWPAIWDKPGDKGTIFPQFYHLWPALMATAKDAGGFTGMFNTGPLVGIVAIGLAVAVARRIAGLPGAWAAAVLLSTNMLQVWQAKYPTAEIFGQMLFMAAMLGVVLAVRTGWRAAAAAAGVMVSLGYLERADGILLVLFAWAGLAALVAARRFDARAAWFSVGMLALLPYGFYQAYVLARNYTVANAIPSLPKVLGGMILLAVIGIVAARQRTLVDRLVSVTGRRRAQVVIGLAFIGICGLLALIGGLRPKLFGPDYTSYNGRRIRSYDEISLIRLSWFFSLPGMFLMFAGIVFVALWRWRTDRWIIALPAVGLLALYCYHVRNSPYLMWSTRRFVTTVVPGMVLLMGCGAALALWLLRRYLPKLAAVAILGVLLGGLTVWNLSESWPLRNHNEHHGSIEVETQLKSLSGDQKGVYLWAKSGSCCNAPYQLFGGPMFTIMDQSSALLPAGPKMEAAAVSTYLKHFAGTGRPVFYVANAKGLPPTLPGVTATKQVELAGALPHWEETYIHRPKKAKTYPYDVTVYKLTPS